MPTYENRQELGVFQLSFNKDSRYPKLGEFPPFTAKEHCQGKNQAFRHVFHWIAGEGKSEQNNAICKRPCKTIY